MRLSSKLMVYLSKETQMRSEKHSACLLVFLKTRFEGIINIVYLLDELMRHTSGIMKQTLDYVNYNLIFSLYSKTVDAKPSQCTTAPLLLSRKIVPPPFLSRCYRDTIPGLFLGPFTFAVVLSSSPTSHSSAACPTIPLKFSSTPIRNGQKA
jgi:hypothetical protein